MNSTKLNAVVLNILEQYICQGSWSEARNLVHDDRFQTCCKEDASEILNLLMHHLTPENFASNAELFQTAEHLLKATAEHANTQDMVMELLDRLESVTDDNVLISLMKALSVVLLRLPEKKSLSIEWCLTSILNYIKRLPCPEGMQNTFDLEKVPLLENDPAIDRVLQLHLILLLFLEPLVKLVVQERLVDYTARTLENTRQNVLVHFLLNMMDTTLNRLYIPYSPEQNTNTYVKQCRETLTTMLTELLGSDPMFLLAFIEKRIRYPMSSEEEDRDMKKVNVFLVPHKTSIVSYGHYFHTLLVHGLAPENTPKVYKGDYVFMRFMYLVTEMLKTEDQNVQMKGIEMGHKLLLMVSMDKTERRSSEYLELDIFETFFDRMIQLMTYSENELIRRSAIKYTEALIMSFDDPGRLIILENLFKVYQDNKGLSGYLPILYKNMVVDALNSCTDQPLPPQYTGKVFQRMLLKYICGLPQAEKTNILDCQDRILAALNMVRFFALRDTANKTSFWDIQKELGDDFLEVLRKAIDLSRAHYAQYKKNIEDGKEIAEDNDISLSMYGKDMPELSMEQKLVAMNNCLNAFDLLDSLLARVNEWISSVRQSPLRLGSALIGKVSYSIPRSTAFKSSTSRFLSSNKGTDGSIEEFRRKQEQLEEEFYKNTPITPTEGARSSTGDSSEAEDEHTKKIRRDILEAAMQQVPTLGWTKEAICKGAESLGYPGVVHGMFPRGNAELIEYFYLNCTERLVEWMDKETEGGTKVPSASAFVSKAVQQRLRMLSPYLSSWPQAMAVMSLPQNAVKSLANLLALVDEICYYSGDKAVDFAWYSRRVGLAGIYKVTELYMLQDKSEDFKDTWTFLERRMEEAVLINKVLESSDEVSANVQNAVGAVFSTARNIIGLNFGKR